MFRTILLTIFVIGFSYDGFSQTDTLSMQEQLGGDGYREGQYPGLGRAASEIFYSKKRVSFSGYAEIANVFNGGKPRDTSSEEIELYYSQLYRIAPFLGIRLTDNWFWITEFGFEYFEGNGESEYHFFPETYMDFIYKPWMSFRLGVQPLNIGYINNNDEPLLFMSVNRPETERIILPSEWIEVGISFYGDIANKFNYAVGLTNGILAREFVSPSWIRNGAEAQFKSFNKIAFHGQINYLPLPSLTISLSGYYNDAGRGDVFVENGSATKVNAPLGILSGYVRWDYNGFGIIGMGSMGNIMNTDDVYGLTQANQGVGQVIGESVFGYYIEPSYDLFSLFNVRRGDGEPGNIFTISDQKLPIFIRYERLNTHNRVDDNLRDLSFNSSNLNIWMIGMNYKPNHFFVFKFDVRFRENFEPADGFPAKETLYELGIGIEY